jgi:hypothetical protein
MKIAVAENEQSIRNDDVVLYLLERYDLLQRTPQWWKDAAWCQCFNAAKSMERNESTKERRKSLVFYLIL